MKKKKAPDNLIADNKKARHDYFLEKFFEAGLMLEGWEVKGLRDGRAQLKESYVRLKNGEAWLIGAHISPPTYMSTHTTAEPTRSRKLLLHEKELKALDQATTRDGYTLVPVNLHWRRSKAKLDIALAKGKKQHDKRATEKKKDWQRQQQQLLKK